MSTVGIISDKAGLTGFFLKMAANKNRIRMVSEIKLIMLIINNIDDFSFVGENFSDRKNSGNIPTDNEIKKMSKGLK